jgi:hypothetical protein
MLVVCVASSTNSDIDRGTIPCLKHDLARSFKATVAYGESPGSLEALCSTLNIFGCTLDNLGIRAWRSFITLLNAFTSPDMATPFAGPKGRRVARSLMMVRHRVATAFSIRTNRRLFVWLARSWRLPNPRLRQTVLTGAARGADVAAG